jgi:hypothetical protein
MNNFENLFIKSNLDQPSIIVFISFSFYRVLHHNVLTNHFTINTSYRLGIMDINNA